MGCHLFTRNVGQVTGPLLTHGRLDIDNVEWTLTNTGSTFTKLSSQKSDSDVESRSKRIIGSRASARTFTDIRIDSSPQRLFILLCIYHLVYLKFNPSLQAMLLGLTGSCLTGSNLPLLDAIDLSDVSCIMI